MAKSHCVPRYGQIQMREPLLSPPPPLSVYVSAMFYVSSLSLHASHLTGEAKSVLTISLLVAVEATTQPCATCYFKRQLYSFCLLVFIRNC